MEKTERRKKTKKIIRRILLSLAALLLIAVGSLAAYDGFADRAIMKKLDEMGYVNRVSVGTHDLNVYLTGNEDCPYTVVFISGLGSMASIADTEPLTDRLGDRYRFAIVDRSGYGLSEDTREAQTVEQVVEDYRTALRAAGVEAPYVLMAHSIGGVHTSYWQAAYPDEIKAAIYLDCTKIGNPDALAELVGEGGATLFMKTEAALIKIGIDRIAYSPDFEIGFYADESKKELGTMLWRLCPISWARCSEEDTYFWSGIRAVSESMSPNDIPKLWISADPPVFEGARERFDYYKSLYDSLGADSSEYDKTDEEIEEYVKDLIEFNEINFQPYLNALGNVTLTYIPGHHYIFAHKPDEVAKAVGDFLASIES